MLEIPTIHISLPSPDSGLVRWRGYTGDLPPGPQPSVKLEHEEMSHTDEQIEKIIAGCLGFVTTPAQAVDTAKSVLAALKQARVIVPIDKVKPEYLLPEDKEITRHHRQHK